jgi:hypothetical protein
MFKLIGKTLIAAGNKLSAVDTEAIKARASARGTQALSATARGIVASAQFIERHAAKRLSDAETRAIGEASAAIVIAQCKSSKK